MNIRYLGQRPNRREVRGHKSGNRYRYSSLHREFTIDPADQLQFVGETEDSGPKFEIIEQIADLTSIAIPNLPNALRGLDKTALEAAMNAEINGPNRVGAREAIQRAINALP